MSGAANRPYIADLNAIPTPQELALQQQETFNLDDELAKFTNTEFFDLNEMPEGMAGNSVPYHPGRSSRSGPVGPRAGMPSMHYIAGSYPFTDFSGYEDLLNDDQVVMGPGLQQAPYPPPNTSSSTATSPTTNLMSSPLGLGPANSTSLDPNGASGDEKSRQLAEEDKRRRNTAASARFRVKKKQREQALEQSVKEQTEKNTQLEIIIHQLKMENKWLKNLVTEKNENKDVAELLRKYNDDDSDARSPATRKDGVGTAKVAKGTVDKEKGKETETQDAADANETEI
ncbi:MAG: hypothetical protein M1838_004429 [Thelocarpon superellum]|nr:MAG: hypothetical protein M1838_004429 [Thelocarpon superellum]